MARGNGKQAIFHIEDDYRRMVEDESYFWTLSRYLHLNPVRGKRPLVAHPRDWPWSSYPGFCSGAHKRLRTMKAPG